MNDIIIWFANICIIIYYLNYIFNTYSLKKNVEINIKSKFLFLYLLSSIIWFIYTIYNKLWNLSIIWIMIFFSILQTFYYKFNLQFLFINNNVFDDTINLSNDVSNLSHDTLDFSNDTYIIDNTSS
jgi:hypothetical protein